MHPAAPCFRMPGLCGWIALLIGLCGCDPGISIHGFVSADPGAGHSEIVFLKQRPLQVERPLPGATIELLLESQVVCMERTWKDGKFGVGRLGGEREYRLRVTRAGYKPASVPVTIGAYEVEVKLAPLKRAAPPHDDRAAGATQ